MANFVEVTKGFKKLQTYRQLSPFQKLYIKRYNKKAAEITKQPFQKIFIGCIVKHKTYGHLRFVSRLHGNDNFGDDGQVFATPVNSFCVNALYEEI